MPFLYYEVKVKVYKSFRDEEKSQEQKQSWERTVRKYADQQQGKRRNKFQEENKEGKEGEKKVMLHFNNVILQVTGRVPYGGESKREREGRSMGEDRVLRWVGGNGGKKQVGLQRFKGAGK